MQRLSAVTFLRTSLFNRLQRITATALLSLVLSPAAFSGDDGDCISDWGTAGEIVRRERLVTVEQLAAGARRDLGGAIIKATLCRESGAYVYRLVVREESGQMRGAVVSADSGVEFAKRR